MEKQEHKKLNEMLEVSSSYLGDIIGYRHQGDYLILVGDVNISELHKMSEDEQHVVNSFIMSAAQYLSRENVFNFIDYYNGFKSVPQTYKVDYSAETDSFRLAGIVHSEGKDEVIEKRIETIISNIEGIRDEYINRFLRI
ncbi:MAG: hypothetical protein ABH828_03865 [archaeon]